MQTARTRHHDLCIKKAYQLNSTHKNGVIELVRLLLNELVIDQLGLIWL